VAGGFHDAEEALAELAAEIADCEPGDDWLTQLDERAADLEEEQRTRAGRPGG
jgi:hypothetical protein